MEWIRNGVLGLLVLLVLLAVWLRGRAGQAAPGRDDVRRRAAAQRPGRARRDATVARQRLDASPATMALEGAERDGEDEMRDEIAALVERQPDDVAALLRGWLVERA